MAWISCLLAVFWDNKRCVVFFFHLQDLMSSTYNSNHVLYRRYFCSRNTLQSASLGHLLEQRSHLLHFLETLLCLRWYPGAGTEVRTTDSICASTAVPVAVNFWAKIKLCCIADAFAAKKPCRVQGVAICWSKEAIYYISLNPAVPVVVAFVAKMLASKHAQKITYDLKAQLAALLAGNLCSMSC